jgi:hypothetical protein
MITKKKRVMIGFTLLFIKYLAELSKAVRTPRGDQLEEKKKICI